jgi:hypothetical protein
MREQRVLPAERRTGLLVRVGADSSCGGASSPIRTSTGEFVYVPNPERLESVRQVSGRPYSEVAHRVRAFLGSDAVERWLPHDRYMHLDPDFDCLTYGDTGALRGSRVAALSPGDFLAFYASLRPVDRAGWLVYALIGFLTVERVERASEVRAFERNLNAHTRRARISPDDVVVFGAEHTSGRLERAIPIAEYRGCAYRVRRDLLDAWGGLSSPDGHLQRSAVPPLFRDPQRFLDWLDAQHPRLIKANWETVEYAKPRQPWAGGARHEHPELAI